MFLKYPVIETRYLKQDCHNGIFSPPPLPFPPKNETARNSVVYITQISSETTVITLMAIYYFQSKLSLKKAIYVLTFIALCFTLRIASGTSGDQYHVQARKFKTI
jgi:hypothetical protein